MSDSVTNVNSGSTSSADAVNATNTENVAETSTTENLQNQAQPQVDNNSNAELGELGDLYNDDNGAEKQSNVPESYTFTDVNGNALELDAETSQGFTNLFKDAGLSQEQASKMFNAYVADIKEMSADFEQEAKEQQAQQKKEWVNQVANDKELGGQNLAQTKMNISKVMQQFGSPELKKYLNETGVGYNPEFIRMINKVGSMLGNDNQFIDGNGATPNIETRADWAKKRYPNSPEMWK